MELWLYMLGISNTTRSSLKKFVKDLVSSSPDLQNKINTLSPISVSYTHLRAHETGRNLV